MVKVFIAILFSLLISFRVIIPFVEYWVNYDYISKVLCINKDKPELKCNGKCHLMKQIAKTSEQESTNNSSNKNTNLSKTLDSFLVENSKQFLPKITTKKQIKLNYYFNLYHFLFHTKLLKPPIFQW